MKLCYGDLESDMPVWKGVHFFFRKFYVSSVHFSSSQPVSMFRNLHSMFVGLYRVRYHQVRQFQCRNCDFNVGCLFVRHQKRLCPFVAITPFTIPYWYVPYCRPVIPRAISTPLKLNVWPDRRRSLCFQRPSDLTMQRNSDGVTPQGYRLMLAPVSPPSAAAAPSAGGSSRLYRAIRGLAATQIALMVAVTSWVIVLLIEDFIMGFWGLVVVGSIGAVVSTESKLHGLADTVMWFNR